MYCSSVDSIISRILCREIELSLFDRAPARNNGRFILSAFIHGKKYYELIKGYSKWWMFY